MSRDYKDIYAKYVGHPSYNNTRIIEDNLTNIIIQKYMNIIFTNKGDVFGDPNFGADLVLLLHTTKVSAKYVERTINEQIVKYIPELSDISYDLKVTFEENPNNYTDIMLIDFKVREEEVNVYFE